MPGGHLSSDFPFTFNFSYPMHRLLYADQSRSFVSLGRAPHKLCTGVTEYLWASSTVTNTNGGGPASQTG
jgi:hypothetical protein